MSNHPISDEDKTLFLQMMQDVKPIGKTNKAVQTHPRLPTPLPRKKEWHPAPKVSFNLSNHYTDPVGADSVLSYCKQSIPKKRLLELRSGQIHIQARLDLHGLRPEAACESLCQFVERQGHLGHRCLLVIHGKGSKNGEAPILKNLVNHWLKQITEVLALHSALARDGGTGAVYVLLQKYHVK